VTRPQVSIALAASVWLTSAGLGAHEAELEEILVFGRAEPLIGRVNSASSGQVGADDLMSRPLLRAGELLEVVPGMAVTQHSGTGKANQYFLRGFNLDHGTDFAAFVDGVPLNQRSHGHGQGYLDLNPIIPELVERIEFAKGPYEPAVGDFASAGYARYTLKNHLHEPFVRLGGGEFGWARGVAAGSTPLAGGAVLGAVEAQHYDGPWRLDEDAHKLNALVRYGQGTAEQGLELTLMAYDAAWDATDQIPERAIRDGRLDRLGFVDGTLGGKSERQSLNLGLRGRLDADTTWQANVYAVHSDFALYSNFTYFLDDPVRGDQLAQFDRRWMTGMNTEFARHHALFGRRAETRIGAQVRHDAVLELGLARSQGRRLLGFVRADEVDETSLGLYLENAVVLTPWLRAVAGLRADRYWFTVDADTPLNAGAVADTQLSPKAGLILTPHAAHEVYLNYGRGFHSNDARGTTQRLDPASGLPTDPVDPLVTAWGGEIGWRAQWWPGLQSTFALWYLELDSELVFVGDAGTTEASGASRRHGIEWSNFYRVNDWLALDLDLALSQARLRGVSADDVPNAVGRVLTTGVTLGRAQGAFGALRLRHLGDTPLSEDGAVYARPTTVVNLRAGYRWARRLELALDVFNLFDVGHPDISYFFASCLPGDPPALCGAGARAGVEDRHIHPVEPRGVRGTVTVWF